jgi:hypothetical protein
MQTICEFTRICDLFNLCSDSTSQICEDIDIIKFPPNQSILYYDHPIVSSQPGLRHRKSSYIPFPCYDFEIVCNKMPPVQHTMEMLHENTSITNFDSNFDPNFDSNSFSDDDYWVIII